MNCKNCDEPLNRGNKYCPNCGAQIVTERLTIKKISTDFTNDVLGWDNKYFKTAKQLVLAPEKIFTDFIGGVRKRYLSPFTYFSIGITLAIILYSFNSKAFMNNMTFTIVNSTDTVENVSENENKAEKQINDFNSKLISFILKYYNLIAMLLLPVYALIAFWVFRKPYNYAEHLVISTYLQGFLVVINVISFYIGIALNKPETLNISFIIAIISYLYAYGRLYKLTFKQYVLKLFKFASITFCIFLILVFLGVIIGILFISPEIANEAK